MTQRRTAEIERIEKLKATASTLIMRAVGEGDIERIIHAASIYASMCTALTILKEAQATEEQ